MRARRRDVLRWGVGAGVLASAGCLDGISGDGYGRAAPSETAGPAAASDATTTVRETPSPTDTDSAATPTAAGDRGPPTAAERRYLGHDRSVLRDAVLSDGLPNKGGIPPVDDPTFTGADAADVADEDVVFGVLGEGVAKAYPRTVLLYHEVVNDTLGETPVAITYCPLTGTAQGFERGGAAFGASGLLLNSNLVLYDRTTDTLWPQIPATGIDGPLAGASLREFRVVWTSWVEWRRAHPNTQVLTEDTGYVRRYGTDPYGGYTPRDGYYAEDGPAFEPLVPVEHEHPKTVVLGARSGDDAIAFHKRRLLEKRVRVGYTSERPYVAVADRSLSTGYVYANERAVEVTAVDDGYRVEGRTYAAGELPLERTVAFDAMWFAWTGFYPESTYVR